MPRTPITQQHIRKALQQRHALSGSDLVDFLAKGGYEVNKTSVYRALEKMLEAGELCRVDLGGGVLQYELREKDHHDHLVCENCGRVQSISCSQENTREIDGFLVHHHHATYFGLCSVCQPGATS